VSVATYHRVFDVETDLTHQFDLQSFRQWWKDW